MPISRVLTKFATFHENLFSLDKTAGVKLSLPSEFNDIFDSQIYLSDAQAQQLSNELKMLVEFIQFYTKRISNTLHVLSLSGRSALALDTSNMWGIYANNGKGVALEFDYEEIEEGLKYPQTIKILEEQIQSNEIDLNLVERITPVLSEIRKHSGYSTFFFKVEYTNDYITQLNNSFEAYLYKEMLLVCGEYDIYNNVDIEMKTNKFYLSKSKIWEHECEYRILDVWSFYNNYAKPKKTTFNEHKIVLDDFIKNEAQHIYQYGTEYVAKMEDNIDGNGAIPQFYMPYPKNIYLGWNFNLLENSSSKKEQIVRFCEKYNIGLYQLDKIVSFEANEFNKIKIM